MIEQRHMTLNMGPQHPATHGVLRVILDLEGEIVRRAVPVIGHLHRGVEKLGECHDWHQNIFYTDRLDYTSALSNNLAYCLTVEKLCGIEVPERATVMRVICSEISRIAAHLVWLATHALDVGAMTPYFYIFREREQLLDMIESLSGQRLTPSYIRIGGLMADVTDDFIPTLQAFIDRFDDCVNEYEDLLTNNPIWRNRLTGVGIMPPAQALDWGVTGPSLRGSGIAHDLRKCAPYCGYETYEFDVPVGTVGDSFDRYTVRVQELRQSARIIRQALKRLPDGPVMADIPWLTLPEKAQAKGCIASLIRHFKIAIGDYHIPKGEVYQSIENSKGELGFFVVSDGTARPYRLRIKSSNFMNLAALPKLIDGSMITDVVTVIGSIDIVLGEIDR